MIHVKCPKCKERVEALTLPEEIRALDISLNQPPEEMTEMENAIESRLDDILRELSAFADAWLSALAPGARRAVRIQNHLRGIGKRKPRAAVECSGSGVTGVVMDRRRRR